VKFDSGANACTSALFDEQAQLALMDANGIDVQVMSVLS
jgi:acyl CoA:acetate/3-ketoacid CoA transferase